MVVKINAQRPAPQNSAPRTDPSPGGTTPGQGGFASTTPSTQDSETEGFSKLRASPAFVFVRSTEPYLGVYAEFGARGVAEACADAGFGRVEAVAATGRHFSLVAAKDGDRASFVDRREATKLPDTHLKTWESKAKS